MSTIRAWCQAVEGKKDSFEGKLALSNLVHDLDSKHVARRLLKRLMRSIRKLFSTWNEHPLYLLTSVADSEPTEYFCHGSLGPDRGASCSRVVLDRDFFNHNVSNRSIGRLIEGPTVHDAHLEMVMKDPAAYADNNFPSRKARHGFVWVTETDSLREVVEKERRKRKRPADRVRNKLGLSHFLPAGEPRLLEIRYPNGFFKKHPKVRFAAPTFLEGRPPNMIYRSLRNNDWWGITVDLDNGSEGLPEAVHGRIRFTGRGFEIHDLGRFVAVTAGYSYKKLFATAPTKWSSARIAELEDLAGG